MRAVIARLESDDFSRLATTLPPDWNSCERASAT